MEAELRLAFTHPYSDSIVRDFQSFPFRILRGSVKLIKRTWKATTQSPASGAVQPQIFSYDGISELPERGVRSRGNLKSFPHARNRVGLEMATLGRFCASLPTVVFF